MLITALYLNDPEFNRSLVTRLGAKAQYLDWNLPILSATRNPVGPLSQKD